MVGHDTGREVRVESVAADAWRVPVHMRGAAPRPCAAPPSSPAITAGKSIISATPRARPARGCPPSPRRQAPPAATRNGSPARKTEPSRTRSTHGLRSVQQPVHAVGAHHVGQLVGSATIVVVPRARISSAKRSSVSIEDSTCTCASTNPGTACSPARRVPPSVIGAEAGEAAVGHRHVAFEPLAREHAEHAGAPDPPDPRALAACDGKEAPLVGHLCQPYETGQGRGGYPGFTPAPACVRIDPGPRMEFIQPTSWDEALAAKAAHPAACPLRAAPT